MNGLKYIREKHKISVIDLALQLGVSRQVLSEWERGKKSIPKKRLEELSAYFCIPKEYFCEMSEIQELEINSLILNQQINNPENEVTSCFDDGEGNFITITEPHPGFVEDLQYNDSELLKKKLLKKIDSIIGDDEQRILICSIYERINVTSDYVELFDRFSNIAKAYWLRGLLIKVIRALELSLDVKEKTINIPYDFYRFNESVSDEDEFVQRLVKTLTKEHDEQEKRLIAEEESHAAWAEASDKANGYPSRFSFAYESFE